MASVYFDSAVGGDGTTLTDDSNATTGLGNGGHRTRFVPGMANVVGIGNFVKTKATEAAASAASAVASPGTSATSTTSLTIGAGSKSLTIQTGKSIVVGMTVKIASTASPGNWMAGDVTSYTSGTGALVVTVLVIAGSGTFADWTVSLSGALNGDPLLKTGGTMTGAIVLPGNPTLALQAAPKQYIDALVLAPIIGRGSNTALSAAERGSIIVLSNAFTQTIEPGANLGYGWWCYLQNNGYGIITLDPSGSETINGLLSTIAIYPGEGFVIGWNGSAFYTVGRSSYPVIASSSYSAAASLAITQPFSDPEIKSFELWMELIPSGITNGMNITVGGWSGAAGHIRTYYEFSSSYSMSDRVTVSGATQVSGSGVSTDRISLYAECLDIQNAGEKARFNVDVAAVTSSVRRLRKNVIQSTTAAVEPTSLTIDASQATMTGTYRIIGSRV